MQTIALPQQQRRANLKEQFEYCKASINYKRLMQIGVLMWTVHFGLSLVLDLEYGREEAIKRTFLRFLPLDDSRSLISPPAVPRLMPNGLRSLDFNSIRQGHVFDCKFLATTSAFLATDDGPRRLARMIHQNNDGTCTVTFEGAPEEPVTVAALTGEELDAYAHAVAPDGTNRGAWLPLLEKAYGQYRNTHQSISDLFLRTVRHALSEFRLTPMSILPGFGAAYGAKDEEAMRLLTGHQTKIFNTVNLEIGEFGIGKMEVTSRQLHSWLNRNAVLSEFYNEQDNALGEAVTKHRTVIATTDAAGDFARYGLHTNHAYSIIGYDSKTRTLQLRDPIGPGSELINPATGEAADGVSDGVFEMPLADFNRCFSRLRIEMN